QVRREVWNAARKGGQTALARELKGARYALWKNPGDLTARQHAKLAWIARVNDRLYRAYLLKEELRLVFTLKGVRATVLLEAWLAWARRCRIPALLRLAKAIAPAGAARPSAAGDPQPAGGRHRPGVHGDRLQQAGPHQRGRGAGKVDDRRRGQLLVQLAPTAQCQHRPGQPSTRPWGIQPGEHALQQAPHRIGVIVLVGQCRPQTDKLGGERPRQGPQQRRVQARQVNQRIVQLVQLLVVVVPQHPAPGPPPNPEHSLD